MPTASLSLSVVALGMLGSLVKLVPAGITLKCVVSMVVSSVVSSGRQVTPGCGLLPTAGLWWSPWRRLHTVGLQAGWAFQCHLERLCRVPA